MNRDNQVAIVTLQGFENYGNLLQNYAVQQVWKALGYDPVSLIFNLPPGAEKLKKSLKSVFLRASACFPNPRRASAVRYNAFRRFSYQAMPKRVVSPSALRSESFARAYAYFSIGSDQVWNPFFHHPATKHVWLLPFAKREQRVCVSPSFGISRLPEHERERFARGLRGFDRLNVREKDGAMLIHELTGQDAEVIVDPTLALTREEWRSFCQTDAPQGKNYILLYYLGEYDPQDRAAIERLAKGAGLEIIDLMDQSAPCFRSIPPDFVRLIADAQAVFTDSFHACVFSIIFNTPFVLFDRKLHDINMGSRGQTLLDTFGLEGRHRGQLQLNDSVFGCSFGQANAQLALERERFFAAIKSQLSR